MKKILAFCAFTIAFTACKQYSSEYKMAQQENDSLKLQIEKNEAEMNEILRILDDIESDIQSIRQAEDLLTIQKDSELSASGREQIKHNMTFIAETLKKNKKQLAELEEKLKNSNVQSASLRKTIERLTTDINEKSELVVKLRNELGKKDEQINELSEKVEGLSEDVKILEEVNISQSEMISEQDQTINMAYYCFGTKKELKEQNILTGGGLFSKSKTLQGSFNKEYFIAIDKRKVTEVPLFSSKAKVKTNHPEGSYSFFRDPEGNLSLKVINVSKFWSLSKYLVIEVG